MAYDQAAPPPEVPRPVIRFSRPKTTGETVTVACKLPSGVILRCFEKFKVSEPQRDGSYKDVDVFRPIPEKQFIVRGTWTASAGQAYNRTNHAVQDLLPGGYALTHGCPREVWDSWLHANRNSPIVRNQLIFAFPNYQTTTEEAKKLRATKTGLEPLDKDNPSDRMPGGVDRRTRINILEEGGPDTFTR
jgi:hypothetical protein